MRGQLGQCLIVALHVGVLVFDGAFFPWFQKVVEAGGETKLRCKPEEREIDGATRTEINKSVEHFQHNGHAFVAIAIESNATAHDKIRTIVVNAESTVFQIKRYGDDGRFYALQQ